MHNNDASHPNSHPSFFCGCCVVTQMARHVFGYKQCVECNRSPFIGSEFTV